MVRRVANKQEYCFINKIIDDKEKGSRYMRTLFHNYYPYK